MTAPAIISSLRAAGCVFAEDEAALLIDAAAGPTELAAMVSRRVAGHPLEQVLGWAEFAGLRIHVTPRVFVPRRRTELLVRLARELAPAHPVVLDLCCGTGAVAAALAATLDNAEIHAADIDPDATTCARRNLPHGHVHEGDLYTPLPIHLRGRVDILVANAPYVPTDAISLMPPEARLHEPRTALDGGVDGLDIQRRVTAHATDWLIPGGHLLIETSRRQAPETARACTEHGFTTRVVTSDDLDATAVVATKPVS